MTEDTAERWLPVVGWAGLYEVSDLGRVRSLDRYVTFDGRWGPVTMFCPGQILSTKLSGRGYLTVCLCRDGVKVRRPVHLLVLEAFVGPPEPGQEGRHGRNGKRDNRLTELCWGTRKQNLADRERDDTMNNGERHGNAKLTDDDIREIRRRYATGEYQRVIAVDFGIEQTNVSSIVRRKTWDHVA